MSTIRHKKLYHTIAPVLQQGDFFVHIGANDGVTNDPIFDFIEPFSLRGLAVEPVKSAFQQLTANYRSFSGVTCVNAAIYANRPSPIYRIRDNLIDKHPVFSQASTANKNQLLTHLQLFLDGKLDAATYEKTDFDLSSHQRENIESYLTVEKDVLFLTFEELLDRYQVQAIDFLNIDAEGIDYDILMSLDLRRWTPKILIIETVLFSEDQKKSLAQKLAEHGYSLAQKFDFYSNVYLRKT